MAVRARRPVRSRHCGQPVADAELADVLAEIAQLMDAEGALVTLHATTGEAPLLLGACVGPAFGSGWSGWIEDARLAAFGRSRSLDPSWVDGRFGGVAAVVMLLPVSPVDGHNRMVVSVLFHAPAAALREHAERLFATRRPMAMGYFRLWQLERVRARRLAALEAACDVTELGLMLFTRQGELTFGNAAASDLLAAGDGLRRRGPSVRATDIADDVKFQVALHHAVADNESGAVQAGNPRPAPLVRLRRAAGDPLVAIVIAASERAVEPSDVAVMVYLLDPAFDMGRLLKPVCDAFKLSPVERQLTCHLAAGRSITDAAKALRVQVQTARGYLKNIFVKTDTRRQAELVHLMHSNVFRIGRGIFPQVL